jgi:hypothetical protein
MNVPRSMQGELDAEHFRLEIVIDDFPNVRPNLSPRRCARAAAAWPGLQSGRPD